MDTSTAGHFKSHEEIEESEARRIVALARKQALCHSSIILSPELIISTANRATDALRAEKSAIKLPEPSASSPVTVCGRCQECIRSNRKPGGQLEINVRRA